MSEEPVDVYTLKNATEGQELVTTQGLVGACVKEDGSLEVRKDISFNTNELRQKIVLSKAQVHLIGLFLAHSELTESELTHALNCRRVKGVND